MLVAETDLFTRRFVGYFLKEVGYDVKFVGDGYAALDCIRLNQPALLITEILLPRLNGLALCRLLSQDRVTSGVPILACGELDDEVAAREAGANAFMKKPVEKARFLNVVSLLSPFQNKGQEDA